MSDVSEKRPFENNKFFTALRPYLTFVDSTRFFTIPFSWLYILFAAVFLLTPFATLFFLIDNGFFKYAPGKIIVSAILSWIAILIAAWIAFQVWWNRKKVVHVDKLDTNVVINALSHLVYTFCEASAHFVGVAGFFIGLFALLFGGGLLETFNLGAAALPVMIASLVGGYLGVWLARLAAFLFRKIAEIIVYVVVRIFKFFVHIIKQLFEYCFIFWQSIVDFIVNGWKVVVALVAKLGNTLLSIAHAPVNSNKASITYNND
jgi:hypothetical protein